MRTSGDIVWCCKNIIFRLGVGGLMLVFVQDFFSGAMVKAK
jgi:hypothetical protein